MFDQRNIVSRVRFKMQYNNFHKNTIFYVYIEIRSNIYSIFFITYLCEIRSAYQKSKFRKYKTIFVLLLLYVLRFIFGRDESLFRNNCLYRCRI